MCGFANGVFGLKMKRHVNKSGLCNEDDFELLKTMIHDLQNEKETDEKFKRHPLKGDIKGFESIHLK